MAYYRSRRRTTGRRRGTSSRSYGGGRAARVYRPKRTRVTRRARRSSPRTQRLVIQVVGAGGSAAIATKSVVPLRAKF